jgi:putative addiction module component (TIGR02574 family)
MHGVKEIIKEAGSLPVEERVIIVDLLLRTLNPPNPDIDRKWVEVAKRRLEELRSGRIKAVSGNQVFANIRKRFGG